MAVFMAQGVRMWWYLGLILAVGQSIGAWLAARFMTGSDMAKVWMRWLSDRGDLLLHRTVQRPAGLAIANLGLRVLSAFRRNPNETGTWQYRSNR